MPTLWKVLVGLLIALPMAAYVAGSLSVSSDDPAPRDPVRISEVRETPEPEQTPGGKDPSAPPRGRASRNGDDEDDNDDDEVRVVTPKPTRVEGDDEPEADDEDSRDGVDSDAGGDD